MGVYLGHVSIFNRCSKFIFEKRIHNTFQIRGDKTQRQQNSSKNKVKFVDCHMKWIVLPYLATYFEEAKYILVYFTNVPAFKNTIKRVAFENAYESSILFSAYIPTFLPNHRLMRPLSSNINCTFKAHIFFLQKSIKIV